MNAALWSLASLVVHRVIKQLIAHCVCSLPPYCTHLQIYDDIIAIVVTVLFKFPLKLYAAQIWFLAQNVYYRVFRYFNIIKTRMGGCGTIHFFSILLTHEGSHREVCRDFQPSLTSSAGPVPRVNQTTVGSVHPQPTLPNC